MWKQFDHVRCIHLKERRDRFESCEVTKNKLEIPLNYFITEKHVEGGKRGAFESHKHILNTHKNSNNCLIFEDDFEMSNNFKWEYLEEVIRFMNYNKDWDIIYLGCFPDVWNENQVNVIGNIYKVKATCIHSYVASKKFMKSFSKVEYCGVPVDEMFLDYNTYAILPSIFRQKVSESDISSLKFISVSKYRHSFENFIENYAMNFGISVKNLFILFCVTLIILCKIRI